MRILITGGTGSLGQALAERLLQDGAERIVIFSRDEAKQQDMCERLGDPDQLRFRLGDVRDIDRLAEVMWPGTIDAVIHAAALKRIDRVSYDPDEVLKTNDGGTHNVLKAAIQARVPKVLLVSSDKAVAPANVYGASKFMAEVRAVSYNVYGGPSGTKSGAVRYGNVWGSRGSVMLKWKQALREGQPLVITDLAMTRFVITLPQAVDFVLTSLARLRGGEVFVPRLPSMRLSDLASVAAPADAQRVVVGLRPGGEKLHERLLSEEELPRTRWHIDRYVVAPTHQTWRSDGWPGLPVHDGYTSATNNWWLTTDELRDLWGMA